MPNLTKNIFWGDFFEEKKSHCSILNFWSTTCLRSHHHCNAASSAGSWAEMGLVPVHLLHLLKRRSLPTHTHTHSHTIHTCCYCTYANIQKCWHPKSLKITTIGVSTNIGLSVVQRRWRKVLVVFVSNFKSLRWIILLKLSHQWIGWLLSLKQSYRGHLLTFGTFAMPCPVILQVTLRYAEN